MTDKSGLALMQELYKAEAKEVKKLKGVVRDMNNVIIRINDSVYRAIDWDRRAIIIKSVVTHIDRKGQIYCDYSAYPMRKPERLAVISVDPDRLEEALVVPVQQECFMTRAKVRAARVARK